jgi:integration host factor subunit alpha
LDKKDIVKNISTKTQLSLKESHQITEFFLNLVSKNFSKGIKISRFGTFLTKTTPQRIGRNPKTKEIYIISKRKKISFKPSTVIRDLFN